MVENRLLGLVRAKKIYWIYLESFKDRRWKMSKDKKELDYEVSSGNVFADLVLKILTRSF